MKTLITTVVINDYVRTIVLSKSVREKYYSASELETLPIKFLNKTLYKQGIKKLNDEYVFLKLGKDRHHFLYQKVGMKKVVSNPNKAGGEKLKIINGQDLHRLTLKTYEASKIKKALKAQFIKEVEKLEPIKQVPILVEAEIRDTYHDYVNNRGQDWDVDNRYLFYGKVFIDVLTGTPDIKDDKIVKTSKVIIEDDHRGYVTGGAYIFTPILESETRQLIFKIYHDQREEVKHFNKLVNQTGGTILVGKKFEKKMILML